MTRREEIAKKLREAGGYLDKNAPGEVNGAAQSVLFELFEATSVRDSNSYSDAFNRLAVLIDPTCQYMPCVCVTWVDDNGKEHEEENLEEPGYSENAYCSVCGYEMMTGEEGWFDYKSEEHGNRLIPNFNYCPNCGARVVRRNVQA